MPLHVSDYGLHEIEALADVYRFLWAENSRWNLRVSMKALLKILTFHQVNPSYLDFIMSFGRQRDGRGVMFTRFRSHCYLDEDPAQSMAPCLMVNDSTLQNTPAVSELGRSGNCFQLSWSLKKVVNRHPTESKQSEWYTRSVGLYHQFDIENGRTLWITTSGREDVQLRIQDLTGRSARRDNIEFETSESSFRLSFQTHLLLCQWAMEGWAEYLQYLEGVVQEGV